MADEHPTPSPSAPDKEAASDLASGFLVGGGRFNLLRELGRGGMGIVWLAHDERLMAPVALKFLPNAVRANSKSLNDLRQETKKSRMLSHPNIIRIYDLYEAPDEAAFISMEYVDGASLWSLRTRQPQRCFTWEYLKPLVKQLCAALEYAHGENVIHRDLKSANMLLDERQRLRLADFGIAARAFELPAAERDSDRAAGTVSYMSPQQIDGDAPCVADDIYALGATLYELLSGHPPFYENDIAYQVRNVLATPISERLADLELDNDVPPAVAAMIMACLAKDPEKRPRGARAVVEWIGLTDARPTPAGPFNPVVVPPPATVDAALPAQKPAASPPPAEESTKPPFLPSENTAARYLSLLAGSLGVAVVAWLAWTHLIPNMPDPAAVTATSATNATTNSAAPSDTNGDKSSPMTALAPSSKGASVSIEFGGVNNEKGLRQMTNVDDGATIAATMDGKDCRLLVAHPRGRCYFQIAASAKSQSPMNAVIEVEYYPAAPGVLQLQFDGTASRPPHYAGGGKVSFNADRSWETATFHVKRARFRNGEKDGADFRLNTSSPELYLRRVTVTFEE